MKIQSNLFCVYIFVYKILNHKLWGEINTCTVYFEYTAHLHKGDFHSFFSTYCDKNILAIILFD